MSISVVVDAAKNLVDDKDAAKQIGVSVNTLAAWRSTGRYCLPFLKVGRKVRYRQCDIDAWLNSRLRESGTTA